LAELVVARRRRLLRAAEGNVDCPRRRGPKLRQRRALAGRVSEQNAVARKPQRKKAKAELLQPAAVVFLS
jgi:hypothetical protein